MEGYLEEEGSVTTETPDTNHSIYSNTGIVVSLHLSQMRSLGEFGDVQFFQGSCVQWNA